MVGVADIYVWCFYTMLQRACSINQMLSQTAISFSRTRRNIAAVKRELQRACRINRIMSPAETSKFRTGKGMKTTDREPALRSNAVKDRNQLLA